MNKPKLDVQRMRSELSQSAFFKPSPPGPAASAPAPKQRHLRPQPVADQPPAHQTSQPVSRLTSQPIGQSTRRPSLPVVERPKAFYITKQLDRRLDEAVRYYQEKHGITKVDRSALVNAILDNDAKWTEEALDLLVDRVLSQLTSRLTG